MAVEVHGDTLEYTEDKLAKVLNRKFLLLMVPRLILVGLFATLILQTSFERPNPGQLAFFMILTALFFLSVCILYIYGRQRIGVDSVKFHFTSDSFYVSTPSDKFSIKLSEIAKLSIKEKHCYRLNFFVEGSEEPLFKIPVSCTKLDLDIIANFFRDEMEARGYRIKEKLPDPLLDSQQDIKDLEVRKAPKGQWKPPESFETAKKRYDELAVSGKSAKEIRDILWKEGFAKNEIDYAMSGSPPRDFFETEDTEDRSRKRLYVTIFILVALGFAIYAQIFQMTYTYEPSRFYIHPRYQIENAIFENLSKNNLHFDITGLCFDRFDADSLDNYLNAQEMTPYPGYYTFYESKKLGFNITGMYYNFTWDVKLCFYCYNNSKICSGEKPNFRFETFNNDCPDFTWVHGVGEKGLDFVIHVDCEEIDPENLVCNLGFE
jgi:hypothetical protein